MTDYISREEALKAIQPRYAPAINKVLAGIIESVPAADVKPVVHGIWLKHDDYGYATCSECGCYFKDVWYKNDFDKYCRSCGAEMDIR